MTRDEIIEEIGAISRPKVSALTSEQINRRLLELCAAAPDPVGAMRLFVEEHTALTDVELADRVMTLPVRAVREVPLSELPLGHPLRKICP